MYLDTAQPQPLNEYLKGSKWKFLYDAPAPDFFATLGYPTIGSTKTIYSRSL